MKKIEKSRYGDISLGLILSAIISMVIIAFCLIQMEGYEYVKLGWFLFFVAANIAYISVGMDRGWAKPDPANALVIASGPLAFFFWTIVGVWNKYIAEPPKSNVLSKKRALGEINKGVAAANKKMPVGAKAYSVDNVNIQPCNVTIKSPYDVLKELNDEITKKLTKFDVFDIEVPKICIKQFLRIVKKRNLDWRPTDAVYDNKETIVVGKKDVDFGQHEKGR